MLIFFTNGRKKAQATIVSSLASLPNVTVRASTSKGMQTAKHCEHRLHFIMAIKQYFAQISTKVDSQLQTTKTVYNRKQILMSMPPNHQSMAVSPAGLAGQVWTGGRASSHRLPYCPCPTQQTDRHRDRRRPCPTKLTDRHLMLFNST